MDLGGGGRLRHKLLKPLNHLFPSGGGGRMRDLGSLFWSEAFLLLPVVIRMTWTALPITSAKRFSPRGVSVSNRLVPRHPTLASNGALSRRG
jgi:hypothetical protein